MSVMECPRGWTTLAWARVRNKFHALADRDFTGNLRFSWVDGAVRGVVVEEHETLIEPPGRELAPDVAQEGDEALD